MSVPKPTGRRIRVPVTLLMSRHHSPLAVALYGLLDVMGGPGRPVEASRVWLAERLGASEGGIAKAIASLSKPHEGDDTTPDSPVYLVSRTRGKQLTAVRKTVPGVPYVDVPEWTLGPGTPLVPHKVWRAYAVMMHLRHARHGTVAHPRRDLAAILRVRADTMPSLVRDAEAAGLLVTLPRPGKETVILPVLDWLPEQARTRVRDELAAACGQPLFDACGQQAEVDNPHPCTGTTPCPDTGIAPHPDTGTPTEDPPYGVPNYEDPAPGRVFAPSALALGTEPPPWRPMPIGSTPPPPRPPRTPLGGWCGRCPSPTRRLEVDELTGHTTGRPCPRCGTLAA